MNETFSRFSRSFEAGFCTSAFLGVSIFISASIGNIAPTAAAIATCGLLYKGYGRLLSEAFDWHCDFKDNVASGLGLSLGLKAGLAASMATGIATLNL